FNNLDEMNDPVSHFVYLLMRSYKIPAKLAFSFIKYGARDHARVPMQWDDSVNAGFNTGHNTWQCVNPDYKQINVKADLASQKSIYRYFQRLLELKKTNETAIYGETEEYDHENRKIIAYSRQYEGNRLFVCANFTNRTAVYELPSWVSDAKLLLSNYESVQQKGRKLTLKPYQAAVFEKEPIRKK
ncbi:MAG: alpha-glucosidase C-terminal domain-containing protein, partial [Erysipelotrichaceae bacterium]|nr:alpha-glucosidase C-terminal domain-containing protein [Erysipelotrichaceae bacterium]